MAQDWDDLLDMDAEKALRPPAAPKGTYRALVESQQQVVSTNKKTPGTEFTFTKLEPQSDVDKEEWESWLAHPAIAGTEFKMTDTFWHSPKAMFRLRDFCEKCGAKPEGKMRKMVADSINATILISVSQGVTRDGEGTYNTIEGYNSDPSNA